MKRFKIEAILAGVFALLIVAVGAGAFYFVATMSVHSSPETLPSRAEGEPPPSLAATVMSARQLARSAVVEQNLPSLSVAVAKDGQMVWQEAFGYADVAKQEPATPATLYRLGSVSKVLTAAAAAALYERGALDLDAPVQQYVPEYPAKQWPLTTRQLLGDIAGVHKFADGSERLPGRHCTNLGEALAVFAAEPLRFKPGTEYRFSTYGWVLASAIIEKASAQAFDRFLSETVLAPLGMTHTRLDGDQVPGLANFYFPRADTRPDLGLEDANPADYSCWFGAGAYVSTPADVVRLGSAMLKPGFLRTGTLSTFLTPQTLDSGASTGFTLGWKVETVSLDGRQVRMLRHRGNTTGGSTTCMLFPDTGLVVAAFTNVSHASELASLGVTIADVFTRAAGSAAAK